VIPMRVMSVAILMGRVVTCERRAEREKGGSSQAAIFHRTPSLCICYVIWEYCNNYTHRLEGIGQAADAAKDTGLREGEAN
jgi:hypothetical protein